MRALNNFINMTNYSLYVFITGYGIVYTDYKAWQATASVKENQDDYSKFQKL